MKRGRCFTSSNIRAIYSPKRLIARRIVCEKKEDDSVNQGEKFGIIRFGSRVDIYFENYKILVKKNQKTVSGETIIANK